MLGYETDDDTKKTIYGAIAAANTAKSEAIAAAQSKIEALDVNDSAVSGQFVTAVSEADRKSVV